MGRRGGRGGQPGEGGRGEGSRIPERRRPVCGTPARSVESRRLRHNPIPSSFFNRFPSFFLSRLSSSCSFCFVPRTGLLRLHRADIARPRRARRPSSSSFSQKSPSVQGCASRSSFSLPLPPGSLSPSPAFVAASR